MPLDAEQEVTVRMLNRLIEPTAGEVLIDGEDIVTMTDDELVKLRRAKLSMVFQSFALMPHLTVLQNAAFGLETDGVDKATRETGSNNSFSTNDRRRCCLHL